jgi:hypothetical protein
VRQFILDALLKPLVAAAFLLGFGGFFVLGGFQSVRVDLAKGLDGKVNGTVRRSHLFGLYVAQTQVTGVTGASVETQRTAAGGSSRRGLIVSNVVIAADSGPTALFWGYSNVDDNYKRAIAKDLNAFIKRGGATRYSEVFAIRNLFGWVGLPFLLLGVVGVLGWPASVVSRWRRTRNGAATGHCLTSACS